MRVQSLLLAKAMFTKRQAQTWAHYQGYRSVADETRNYWRLRQASPSGRVLRTIEFAPGIKATVQRNPGLGRALWHGVKSGYHTYRADILDTKAARHRQAAKNPRRIPGTALEIRYRRTGTQPGLYKHPFEQPVRMVANGDGSVTLRGTKKLHADDRDADFETYLSKSHRRRNPMARRRGGSRGGSNMWLLIGLGVFLLLRPGTLSAGGPTTYAPGTVWVDTTDGTMIVGPSLPGPNWRLATQAEIQMAVIPA
jgi:hypothetical protein